MTGLRILTVAIVWIIAFGIAFYILSHYFMRKNRTRSSDARDLVVLIALVIGATVLTMV